MIHTNGNRRPKSFLVKKGLNKYSRDTLRRVVSSSSLSQVDDSYNTGLSKKELASIFEEANRKDAHVFTLVAKTKDSFDVSVYIIEKAAVESFRKGSGATSDTVSLKSDYFFSDTQVVNNMARMYLLNKKVVIIQHRDEIISFEKEEREAIFVSEVELKEAGKDKVELAVSNVDYRSSAEHAKRLRAIVEKDYIHFKSSTAHKAISVQERAAGGSAKKFVSRKYLAEEALDIADGFYKAMVSGVEKVFVISTNNFTGERQFYFFALNDEVVKGKALIDYENAEEFRAA